MAFWMGDSYDDVNEVHLHNLQTVSVIPRGHGQNYNNICFYYESMLQIECCAAAK